MVVEGKEVTFKHDVYADVYVDILSLMAKCDTAPIHCAKMKALCVQWAKMGRCITSYHTWLYCNANICFFIFLLGMAVQQAQLQASMSILIKCGWIFSYHF